MKTLNEHKTRFVEPVFENSISICFSCSNYYIPYLSTLLISLVCNSDNQRNYDIVIFNKDISDENQQIIQEMFSSYINVSIRFYDVNSIFENTEIYIPKHIDTVTIETYFRILVPYLMRKYHKTLFFDSDMLILDDISKLYDKDIEGYALAATHEILFLPAYSEQAYTEDPKNSNYLKIGEKYALAHLEKLGINNIESYFQAGLILYNNDYFNKNQLVEKLFENIQKKIYLIVDQDALNEICYEKVILLNGEWNYAPTYSGNFIKHMTRENKEKYLSIKKPKVIHFIGAYWKPWNGQVGYYHYKWWEYARKSPYYEEVIARNCKSEIKNDRKDFIELIKNVTRYKKNIITYWKCKVMQNITIGKRKKHYINKKQRLKNCIRTAQCILKG